MRVDGIAGHVPSRPGLVERLRANLREAWEAEPEDVVVVSGRTAVGRGFNQALRVNLLIGARVLGVATAVARSLVPGPAAVTPMPLVTPQAKPVRREPGARVETAPTVLVQLPVEARVEEPAARPRQEWAALAADGRLDRIMEILDDQKQRLTETSRAEREQAMEILLRAVPPEQHEGLLSERFGEILREMRFHASTPGPNPEDPSGWKRLLPPLVPMAELLADCLRLAIACPRREGRPLTAADVSSAGWVAHTLYREQDAARRAAWREAYAAAGSFEDAQRWVLLLDRLRPESRAAAMDYVRRMPVVPDCWHGASVLTQADRLQVLDADVLATVERWLPKVPHDFEWQAVAECRRPEESLSDSAARYARFDEAVRQHTKAWGHGVGAYRAWWQARSGAGSMEEALDLVGGLADCFKKGMKGDVIAKVAEHVMRERRPSETLSQAGARIAGLHLEALDAIHQGVGAWEERREAYERLLATSTGWAGVGVARYRAVAETLAEGESLRDAVDGFLALEKRLEPYRTREENLLGVYRAMKAFGKDVREASLLDTALPDALQQGLQAVEEPFAGLGAGERRELFLKVLDRVYPLSWNSDTAWPEAAAAYAALREAVDGGEPLEAGLARLERICAALKPGAVRTMAREAVTVSEALRLVRVPSAELDDHLTAARVLFSAAESSTYRPRREAMGDYAVVVRDRLPGESVTEAARRLVDLARYTTSSSGRFDPRAAFSTVAKLEGATPQERQKALTAWLDEWRQDPVEALAEVQAVVEARLPGEDVTTALARMRRLGGPCRKGVYQRVTQPALASHAERLDAMNALLAAQRSAKRADSEALSDFDGVRKWESEATPLPLLVERFGRVAGRFASAAEGRAAFDALMGPSPAGVPYPEREQTMLSLLAAPSGGVEAYRDYALVADLRLGGEALEAARQRLEGLRQALHASPEEVREAYRFVTAATLEGRFASADEAQRRLVEGFVLRGKVADAVASALAGLDVERGGMVSREEKRVKIGSVWVSVRE